MKMKFKLIDWIILCTILSTLFYTLANNLPKGVGSFRFLWGPLSLVTIIIQNPSLFKKRPLYNLIFYGLISVGILQYTLWQYMSDLHRFRILEEFFNLSIVIAIWSYYKENNKLEYLGKISEIAFFFIILSLIITNVVLFYEPLIIRNSGNAFRSSPRQLRIAIRTGAIGYGYAQGIVVMIPLLIYHIKKRIRLLFGYKGLIAVLMLFIITNLRSQVFANILIGTFITIFSIAGAKRKKIVLIYMIIVLTIAILIPTSVYIDLLRSVSTYFPEESNTYYKLNDFALFLDDPTFDESTAAGTRAERYPMLLEAFSENPLLGDASYDSKYDIREGGHLYLMNRLAIWGLFGFAFFVSLLYKIYSNIENRIHDVERKYYYMLSILTYIMFGLMKNIGGREPWFILILIIPGLYFNVDYINEKEIHANNIERNNVQK